MKRKITKVEFADDNEFELAPRYKRELVEAHFNELKGSLLNEAVSETETIGVDRRLQHAANEAAALAWTTEFPLLVFPGLFDEIARREKLQALRQARIQARSEMLLEAV